jgi:transcriptional regulator with XRE-family HTH domain
MARRYTHNRNMARRGIPKQINWYLREWMAARGIKKQTDMMELTGWSKATMSQLYNGMQDYSPKIIAEAADALKVSHYELLMHPEEANALRRLRQDALRVVENTRRLDEAVSAEERKTG